MRRTLSNDAHPLVVVQSISALLALKAQTPPQLLDEANHGTVRTRDFTQTPPAEVLSRGQLFFDKVYGDNAASLMKVMDACGTPDLGASARLMYSFFQGNTSVLSAVESMFVSFTGAIATDVSLPVHGVATWSYTHWGCRCMVLR